MTADPRDSADGGGKSHGELLEVALSAASEAAELIHGNRPDELRVRSKSSATDHVTNMDLASEELIRGVLARRRPYDAVLGEEQGGSLDDDRITWVVDPIDGTTNYLYDHPGYAVSIAACLGPEPLAGVVADPTHARIYWATAGGGAWCGPLPSGTTRDAGADRPEDFDQPAGGGRGKSPAGGRSVNRLDVKRLDVKRLNLGRPPPIPEALVATGFGYDPAARGRQGRVAAALLPQIRDIRRVGAAALDLCSVAAGHVDAYYEAGLSIWDLAAGQLVASEAGATVEAIEGGPPRPGSVLVAHPDLLPELRDLLVGCGVLETLGEPR